jgi:CRP-like cAMP-binding protein
MIKLVDYYIEKYKLDIIKYGDLRKYTKLFIFNKNEYIYQMDEEIDYFYFFVSGKAKVFTIVENGRSLLLRFYKPLMVIGDLEFANSNHNYASTSIMALNEVHCIGIPIKILEKEYENDIEFLKFVNNSLAEKLADLSIASSLNLLYPLENRLASYFVYLDNENSNEFIVIDKLTDIAELLGSSYRHLLRVMKKFQNEKLIIKNKNNVKIINNKILKQLAGDLYK